MKTSPIPGSILGLLVLLSCVPARAQWITQVNNLKNGWNAVYLQVDASYTNLNELVAKDAANPIQEIWQWQPTLPTGQFTESPQVPSSSGPQWGKWTRALSSTSDLQYLRGNAAYLVRSTNTGTYAWRVKGKPLAPTYRWSLTGLNFIGFPTPPASPPSFDSFFTPAPELLRTAEIYAYQGGNLGTNNPVRVTALRSTLVARDQAYWLRAGDAYNQYFGPFQVTVQSPEGIRFRTTVGQTQLRIRNLIADPLTVSLRQITSETNPAGQPAIKGDPPLLVRGNLNPTNLTFGYTRLNPSPGAAPQQWTLAPAGEQGSEVEVVLGLDRYRMDSQGATAGDLWAGLIRFTDSLNLSQVDVAVSAEVASTAGLWIGNAAVDQVSHYLKPYAKATTEGELDALLSRLGLAEGADGYHYELDPNSGRVLVFGGPAKKSGSYLLDGPIKVDPGTVARPFPLRLILHNSGSGVRLLQHVYHGIGIASNVVVTTQESSLLPSQLASARRASAVHLPVSGGNTPWDLSGTMKPGGTLTTTVDLAFDDQASNPFLHTYHPDHDNLDALFQPYPSGQGIESYGVSRKMTLTFRAPADNFASLTTGGQDLNGDYAEVVTFRAKGTQTKEFNTRGSFSLKRISEIATLTQ